MYGTGQAGNACGAFLEVVDGGGNQFALLLRDIEDIGWVSAVSGR